jgi:hypothetical protein
MRPGGHKKGHSQIGESAHAHPLPPRGCHRDWSNFPKIFRRTFRKVPTETDQAQPLTTRSSGMSLFRSRGHLPIRVAYRLTVEE